MPPIAGRAFSDCGGVSRGLDATELTAILEFNARAQGRNGAKRWGGGGFLTVILAFLTAIPAFSPVIPAKAGIQRVEDSVIVATSLLHGQVCASGSAGVSPATPRLRAATPSS